MSRFNNNINKYVFIPFLIGSHFDIMTNNTITDMMVLILVAECDLFKLRKGTLLKL